jgi:thioredoxin reductase (NADPH)
LGNRENWQLSIIPSPRSEVRGEGGRASARRGAARFVASTCFGNEVLFQISSPRPSPPRSAWKRGGKYFDLPVPPGIELRVLPEFFMLHLLFMEKVVIIGTGCAGLTAAIYAARSNLSPLVVTGKMPGGLLTTTSTVENFPGFPEGVDGYQLMVNMQKQAERFGARLKMLHVVESVDLSKRPFVLDVDGERVETQTLIIATGASHRHLGLESEYLLEKKGVTFCATCDGAWPMFRNQPLVVVGGGDSACEEATYLTRFASKVYLVHRRDTLRASKIMAERMLKHEKITPVWDSVITEIQDVKQDKVTGVKLRNLKTGAESVLPCAGVFVAIGHVPNTGLFKGVLDLDENGYVIRKPGQGSATNIPGVFVAGDCSDHVYRQAITAAGMGCAAAIDAERYLGALGT